MTATTTARAARTASPAQVTLIKRLVSEKDGGADFIARALVPLNDPYAVVADLPMHVASRCIDILIGMPAAADAAPAFVGPGYYAKDGEFICVVLNKAKSRRYAKVLRFPGEVGVHAKWEFTPGRIASLTEADRITLDDAKAFGHLHGFCIKCGKPLTDPTSVANGIGPVCIKAFTA
jgi:hypothetical protein